MKKCINTYKQNHYLSSILSNKRHHSAGHINTSSAGTIMALIFSNKTALHFQKKAATCFIMLLAVLGLSLALQGSSTYADSLSLNVSTNNLSLDLLPSNSTGTFSKSDDMNIAVSTTYTSGYTLSIAASTSNTSLTSGDNTISSIGTISGVTTSGISESAFSSSANTQYNNTWAYKPSQYVTVSGDTYTTVDNTGSNSTYKPLPNQNGEILAITDAANSSTDNYTLSIGARANNATPVGSYTSGTFNITAVANIIPLTVIYNANGGYFGDNTSTTTNTVYYNATSSSSSSTETVTKYSHSANIDDDGTASGTYSRNQATVDTITIDGAESLNVTLYYATRSSGSTRDAVYVFAGEWSGTPIKNLDDGQDYDFAGGTGTTMATANTETFTISGDTVTFAFYSGGSSTRYYGYYAVVTATVNTTVTTYDKTVLSGTYATPNHSDSDYSFIGWSESSSDTVATYETTEDIRTKLPYINGDTVTLYAVYDIALGYCTNSATCMQTMSACPTTATDVTDARDGTTYKVQQLADGNCWMLDNLALDPTTLTQAELYGSDDQPLTNASNTTLSYLKNGGGSGQYPASGVSSAWTSSSQNSYNLPYINAASKDTTVISYGAGSGKVGVYYNYCAASAGSYCYASGSGTGNATEDLCPAGWRMPTGGSYDDSTQTGEGEYYALGTALGLTFDEDWWGFTGTTYQTALSTPLSGGSDGGWAGDQGVYGDFWSSTIYDGYSMYYLYVDSDYAYPTGYSDRYGGYSMRCILDD